MSHCELDSWNKSLNKSRLLGFRGQDKCCIFFVCHFFCIVIIFPPFYCAIHRTSHLFIPRTSYESGESPDGKKFKAWSLPVIATNRNDIYKYMYIFGFSVFFISPRFVPPAVENTNYEKLFFI